jgi:hypothetical protein
MRSLALLTILISISIAATGCGPDPRADDGGDDAPGDDTPPCTTGETRCAGSSYETCADGGWTTTETCTGDQVCVDGGGCQTLDLCQQAAIARSYLGCEYWPVDLDNAVEVFGPDQGFGCSFWAPQAVLATYPVCESGGATAGLCDFGGACPAGYACTTMPVCVLDAQASAFAIVVSNPSTTSAVMVTLTNAAGATQQVSVGPSAVQALFPQQLGMPEASLDHSGIETKAYRLTSDLPIVAYQFNPLNNVGVFSNDASLLIPAHAYDVDYLAMTAKSLTRRPARNDYNGYITVVGVAPGTTSVTVTPSAAVRAGTGVAALPAGTPQTFSLAEFQTLNLEAVAEGDLSGSTVTCTQPCGVFVGHEATNLSPGAPVCCADHLEEQLFPASTWGKLYAVARSKPRASPVPDMVRVMAQRPNTVVSFNPPQAGCAGPIGRGQYCDVWITSDVEVSATEPIMVGHYLASNGGVDPDAGDPSLAFAVPTEQYRADYILLVPSEYNQSFMSMIAPAGGTVTIDGVDVTNQLAVFGSNQYKAGRVPTTAGQHHVVCTEGCGVEIYGWSDAVSYLVAGGLDLEQIVVVE